MKAAALRYDWEYPDDARAEAERMQCLARVLLLNQCASTFIFIAALCALLLCTLSLVGGALLVLMRFEFV